MITSILTAITFVYSVLLGGVLIIVGIYLFFKFVKYVLPVILIALVTYVSLAALYEIGNVFISWVIG